MAPEICLIFIGYFLCSAFHGNNWYQYFPVSVYGLWKPVNMDMYQTAEKRK